MADHISSVVDLVHPTVSGISVITTDQVWVLFDREIDETTIANGNFFVTGPDFDTWLGPDLQLFQDAASVGDEGEILQSPGFEGFVQGEISFERIDLSSLAVVSGIDTVGSGLLYRTKAVFTPTNRLAADTTYTVYLSGDEDDTDNLNTGISTRTVFDAVADGGNTGTGEVSFTGGYIGLVVQDTYHVKITTAGDVGDSKFEFWRDSDPFSVFGPFKTKRSGVLLSDGVTAEFTEGSYVANDEWTVVAKSRTIFTGNLSWPFKTGSGSILTVPDTTSTSVIGDPFPTATTPTGTVSTGFNVLSTDPEDGATNQTIPAGDFTITATFNAAIEPTTVVSGVSTTVFTESVTGDPSVPASGLLIADPSVSGQELSIVVAPGQLKENNLVTVSLDSTIQNTTGTSLGSDYEFSFTTTYYPLYCTVRRLRLEIGAFISDVPDDTLNLAIHMASLMADELTWNTDNTDDNYYQFVRSQWTCCKAQEILLLNTTGGAGSLKSKRLGDLAVEYDTTNTNANVALERAIECMAKWEGALNAGGRQVQSPTMVVKGELDLDRPPVGRGWLHSRNFDTGHTPAANKKTRLLGSRRYRGIYSRLSSKRGWWDK